MSRSIVRHRLVGAWATALLLAAVTSAASVPPAAATPKKPPASHSVAASAKKTTTTRAAATAPLTSLDTDDSTRLPKVAHNEAVGDFLHLGYDQRAVAEDGYLTIYDPPSRGGGVRRSTPTDLFPPGDAYFVGYHTTLWSPLEQPMADANQLNGLYLAWTPSGFYLSGAKNVGGYVRNPPIESDPYYQLELYRLPPDGSCASATCALAVRHLPPVCDILSNYYSSGVTAMAVGTVAGKDYLAVGMAHNQCWGDGARPGGQADGVLVYPADLGGSSPPAFFHDFATSNYLSNTVTGLAWDPSGSGRIGVATMSALRTIHAITFSPATGFGAPDYHYWDRTYDVNAYDYSASALSVAAARRPDGSTVFAYGMADGSVKLFDPAVTSKTLLASSPKSDDPVDAVSVAPRIDGTAGLPDLVAVSSTGDSAQLLRYDGGTVLTALPVAPGGKKTTDVGTISSEFPGYKTGALTITTVTGGLRNGGEPFTASFASRPNASYGCWFAPALPGRAAFPTGTVTIDPTHGATPPTYSIGGYTAGSNGDCAATDVTGQWSAYLVVAPVQRPADRTVIQLDVPRSGARPTAIVAGGSAKVSVVYQTSSYALGSWLLVVRFQSYPGPPTSLSLTGRQLDPAGTSQPVYRFDVPATTFSLPVSNPARISTLILPYTVYGSSDGNNYTKLGLLIPQGQPTRATDGSITVAPVSFYWQNPSSGPQITSIRIVSAQDPGAVSPILQLASLLAPASGATVTQVAVCPSSGSASGCDANAHPFANGLDEAPLRIQIYGGDNGTVLPLSDANYGRVYYTDSNDNLVTGLIPIDGSPYFRVSPYPGEYSNDGSAGSIVRPSPTAPVGGRFGYVSTTSTEYQELTAHVGGTDFTSGLINVQAGQFTPQVPAGQQAASGFYVTNCSDYTGTSFCRLAIPSDAKPALFMTTDIATGEPASGVMLHSVGSTALSSLPLQQLAGQPEHTVAASTLSISNGEVTLDTTSGFQPGDSIDTYLVSHGARIKAQAVKVGGGN